MNTRSGTVVPKELPDSQGPPRDTYEPDELAARLGVSRDLIYRGLKDGKIPGIRLGKRIILPRAAIDAWLANAKGTPAE